MNEEEISSLSNGLRGMPLSHLRQLTVYRAWDGYREQLLLDAILDCSPNLQMVRLAELEFHDYPEASLAKIAARPHIDTYVMPSCLDGIGSPVSLPNTGMYAFGPFNFWHMGDYADREPYRDVSDHCHLSHDVPVS